VVGVVRSDEGASGGALFTFGFHSSMVACRDVCCVAGAAVARCGQSSAK
jgi:hypothetical protein